MAQAPSAIGIEEPVLALCLSIDRGRVVGCRLVGVALPDPTRLLRGLPVEAASDRVGRLMALCGRAHAIALAAAGEVALGVRPSAARRTARALLLLAERARTMALRRTIAWPALAAAPARPELARPVLAAAAALAAAIGPTGPRDPLDPDRSAAGAAAARLADALAALADDPIPFRLRAAIPALPGSLASLLGQRLAARLAGDRALASELGRNLARLGPEPAPPPLSGTGEGVGTVATDRGRLRYRVRLVDGRLAGVEASSPTDRLLEGRDPVLAALLGLPAGAGLERAARLAMGLLDPCWPWRLELVPVGAPERLPREPVHA